jgi:hypothetical protein
VHEHDSEVTDDRSCGGPRRLTGGALSALLTEVPTANIRSEPRLCHANDDQEQHEWSTRARIDSVGGAPSRAASQAAVKVRRGPLYKCALL